MTEEFNLRMAMAVPLIAAKGYAADDVEATYRAAEELCERLGPTSDLFAATRGLWNCHLARGELARALPASLLPISSHRHQTPNFESLHIFSRRPRFSLQFLAVRRFASPGSIRYAHRAAEASRPFG